MTGGVTVVVTTYNRAEELCRTIRHLQVLPEQTPLIVVDNASTDGTARAVAAHFPGIAVIRLARNLGAAGRNAGIRRAVTPYVALCDDDTWWAPGALARAAHLLDSHPRLAVITARILVGPEEREDPACGLMANSPLTPAPGFPGYPVLGFMAGASVIRRDALLAAGGFESRFFLGGEERLLAVDLAARGWSLAYVPELIAHHHPSPRRDTPGRRQLLLRNALWFAWLRRPWRTAARETLAIVRRGMREVEPWGALVAAVRGVGWVWRRRAVLPLSVERELEKLQEPA